MRINGIWLKLKKKKKKANVTFKKCTFKEKNSVVFFFKEKKYRDIIIF